MKFMIVFQIIDDSSREEDVNGATRSSTAIPATDRLAVGEFLLVLGKSRQSPLG